MRLKIPDDWNGTDWYCAKVQWPNSQQWFALLSNLLVVPARGRSWDERTGTITDVQEVGEEIIERNIHYIQCEEQMDCTELRACLDDLLNAPEPLTCEELRACLEQYLDPNNAAEPATWPDGDEPDTQNACRIARGAQAAVTAVRDDIEEYLQGPELEAYGVATAATGVIALFTYAAPVSIAFIALGTALIGLGLAWFQATFTDEAMTDFMCIVRDAIQDNTELNDAAVNDIHTGIDTEFGDVILRQFFHDFVDASGKVGLVNSVAAFNIGSGVSCAECDWVSGDWALDAPIAVTVSMDSVYDDWYADNYEVPADTVLVGFCVDVTDWQYGSGWFDFRHVTGTTGLTETYSWTPDSGYAVAGGGRTGEPVDATEASSVITGFGFTFGDVVPNPYETAGTSVAVGGWYQDGPVGGSVELKIYPILWIL
jgi:hypothetical protein